MTPKKKVGHNADDITYILTGKRIKTIVKRGIDLFAREMADRIVDGISNSIKTEVPGETATPENPAYLVLGLHPDALDVVVRAAFRQLAKDYHPDTGEHPDSKKFQAVQEAYNSIMVERKAAKPGKKVS